MLSKLRALGPGLLYAGAAVGVSHIVQSTKAGALYGFVLIIAIVLAQIFKYPFFELGPKYAAHTNQNLLQGFAKLGKGSLVVVAILTVGTMFTIQAAVTVVTAGLAIKIFGVNAAPWLVSAGLLLVCFGISAIGKFSVLDNLMKVIMIVLSITTVVAVVSSFYGRPDIGQIGNVQTFDFTKKDIIFLIAFLGWMPAPLDIAIWHSIWGLKNKEAKSTSESDSMFDFKVGYWGTAILAVCFLLLGANVIYGTDIVLEDAAGKYAGQLIDIYTSSIGNWAYYFIAISAFTTMFSTTLTCLDAMPRVMQQLAVVWKNESQVATIQEERKSRLIWMAIIVVGAVVLLRFFISNMTQMVSIATSFSFLTAPILAILSILLVKKHLPPNFWPKWKYVIAWIGVFFLVLLSGFYLSYL
ncbi:MAG: divalent metal cation transporter [Flavobacteriales bacterium]|nr:divalent metal cation transporter [Flavobacteriales bacterium]